MDGHDDEGNPEVYCDGDTYSGQEKVFYLAHSCDEWIIGGTEQAKQLIAILQKLVNDNPNVAEYRFREND